MEKISIPLAAIRRGETVFSFDVEINSKEISEKRAYIDKLSIQVNVTVLGEDIIVKLAVIADSLLYCDRCGESFKNDVKSDVTTLFTPDSLKIEKAEGGEIRLFDSHAVVLDITQEVIDALFLAIPDKILCKDSCKGLCPYCGVNLNNHSCSCKKDEIDTRWEALSNLNLNE